MNPAGKEGCKQRGWHKGTAFTIDNERGERKLNRKNEKRMSPFLDSRKKLQTRKVYSVKKKIID